MASDVEGKFRALVGAMFPRIWATERAKKQGELDELDRAKNMGGHGFNPGAVLAQLKPISEAMQATLLAIVEKIAPMLAAVDADERPSVFKGVDEMLHTVASSTLSQEAGRLNRDLLFRGQGTAVSSVLDQSKGQLYLGVTTLASERLREELIKLDILSPAPVLPPVSALRERLVHIVVRKGGDESGGTGFVVRSGVVATAAHVVATGEIALKPFLSDGTFGAEILVGRDQIEFHPNVPDVDLAVIRDLSTEQFGYSPLRVGGSVREGDEVTAFGFPRIPGRGNAVVVHRTHITSLAPHLGGHIRSMQLAAILGGGYSGGPVFDRVGALVGIVTELTQEQVQDGNVAAAYSHAVPAEYLLTLVPELRTS